MSLISFFFVFSFSLLSSLATKETRILLLKMLQKYYCEKLIPCISFSLITKERMKCEYCGYSRKEKWIKLISLVIQITMWRCRCVLFLKTLLLNCVMRVACVCLCVCEFVCLLILIVKFNGLHTLMVSFTCSTCICSIYKHEHCFFFVYFSNIREIVTILLYISV